MSVRVQSECSCTKRNISNPERMCKVSPPEECTEFWENALKVLFEINEAAFFSWFL